MTRASPPATRCTATRWSSWPAPHPRRWPGHCKDRRCQWPRLRRQRRAGVPGRSGCSQLHEQKRKTSPTCSAEPNTPEADLTRHAPFTHHHWTRGPGRAPTLSPPHLSSRQKRDSGTATGGPPRLSSQASARDFPALPEGWEPGSKGAPSERVLACACARSWKLRPRPHPQLLRRPC